MSPGSPARCCVQACAVSPIRIWSRARIVIEPDYAFFELETQGACFGEQALMDETSSFTYTAKIRSELRARGTPHFAAVACGPLRQETSRCVRRGISFGALRQTVSPVRLYTQKRKPLISMLGRRQAPHSSYKSKRSISIELVHEVIY